jgi:hypothetical protein
VSQFLTPALAAADPSGDPGNVQNPDTAAPVAGRPRERFLDDLGLGGIRVTNVKEVIGDAHQICATLKAGETEQQIIKLAISQNATLTEANAVLGVQRTDTYSQGQTRQGLFSRIRRVRRHPRREADGCDR